MRSGRWLALAAAAGFALACADDDKGKTYDDPQAFCESLKASWAAAEVRCAGFTAKAASWALDRMVSCERVAAAIAAGRTRYDAAKAEACISTFAGMTCDALAWNDGPPEACAEAVVGQVAAGSACTLGIDVECLDGWCDFADGCFAPGLCRTYRHAGQSCTGATEECGPGLSCSETCFEPTVLTAGQPCGVSGAICGPGLFCDTSGMDLTCAIRRAQGSACSYDSMCASGLQCVAEACAPWVAPGGACVPGEYACRLGASCTAEGACVAWPVLGGACNVPGLPEPNMCLEGWCSAGTMAAAAGTCTAPLAPGATCDPAGPNPCGPGYACKPGTTPVCAPYYCTSMKS
jgi:hypothetical protein